MLAQQLPVFVPRPPSPIERQHDEAVADQFECQHTGVFRRVVERLAEHHARSASFHICREIDGHPKRLTAAVHHARVFEAMGGFVDEACRKGREPTNQPRHCPRRKFSHGRLKLNSAGR